MLKNSDDYVLCKKCGIMYLWEQEGKCPYCALIEREARLLEDNQKLRRQLSVDGKRLNGCMNHASQIARDRDRLLGTVKMAYLKHCLNRDAIGWEELDQALLDTLCEVLGDDGYQEWLNRHRT